MLNVKLNVTDARKLNISKDTKSITSVKNVRRKENKMKNKAMKIMVVVFILLLIADVITTLRLGNLVQYLEANPIYKHVGIYGIVMFNLIVLTVIYVVYTKSKKVLTRYLYLSMIILLCIIRIIVLQNNIVVGNNPPTLEQAKLITPEFKTEAVKKMVIPNIFPWIIGIISFIFFMMDHNIKVKNGISN